MLHWPPRRFAANRHSAVFALAVLLVLGVQGALITSHSYFVDEWQALQIAVESPDLRALLANLRYEGHPPLWYLLLRGLSQIVGPGHALLAASALCAVTVIFVVAYYAPWPRWVRLAVLVSEPILFEYGTVSRGYSLGVALVFVTLALWDRRRAFWIVLALLPLVDFLLGLIAMALIALRSGENGRAGLWTPGVALFASASMLAAWTVLPARDFVSVYPPSDAIEAMTRWMRGIATVMLPVQWRGGALWDTPWVTPGTPLLGLAFLLMAWRQTARRPVERAIAVGFPLVLLGFMVFIHTLAIRHLMLAAVMLLAVLWRQGARSEHPRELTRLWLAIIAACGVATAGFALTRPFDTAPEVVGKIRSLGLERETWLSFPAQHAQGVSALSGIAFEALGPNCRASFVRWNFAQTIHSPTMLRDRLITEANAGARFYLVSQHEPAPGGQIILIATVRPGLNGKIYYIYRVDGARPGMRAAAPPCVPGTRPLPPLTPK